MDSTKERTSPSHSPGPLNKNLPSCAAESAQTPPFSPHVAAALPLTASLPLIAAVLRIPQSHPVPLLPALRAQVHCKLQLCNQ